MSNWSTGLWGGVCKERGIRERSNDQPIDLTREVHDGIFREIGSRCAEEGGMLGGDRQLRRVTHFHYDAHAERTGCTYSPDARILNALLDDWNKMEVKLMGFVHSHPDGLFHPSQGDLEYAERILRHNPRMTEMLMPIVQPARRFSRNRDRDCQMRMFVAFLDSVGRVRIDERPYRIVSDPNVLAEIPESRATGLKVDGEPMITGNLVKPGIQASIEPATDEEPEATQSLDVRTSVETASDISQLRSIPGPGETFRRVERAYDLDRLSKCRVVAVGVGGASQFLEDLCDVAWGRWS